MTCDIVQVAPMVQTLALPKEEKTLEYRTSRFGRNGTIMLAFRFHTSRLAKLSISTGRQQPNTEGKRGCSCRVPNPLQRTTPGTFSTVGIVKAVCPAIRALLLGAMSAPTMQAGWCHQISRVRRAVVWAGGSGRRGILAKIASIMAGIQSSSNMMRFRTSVLALAAAMKRPRNLVRASTSHVKPGQRHLRHRRPLRLQLPHLAIAMQSRPL